MRAKLKHNLVAISISFIPSWAKDSNLAFSSRKNAFSTNYSCNCNPQKTGKNELVYEVQILCAVMAK
jgi:hypothetical protein